MVDNWNHVVSCTQMPAQIPKPNQVTTRVPMNPQDSHQQGTGYHQEERPSFTPS